MSTDLKQAVDKYVELIKADYAIWHAVDDDRADSIRQAMIDEFNRRIVVEVNRKYIKIIVSGSVHSFILKDNDGKFKGGDILKPASYTTAARNFARGNVFHTDFLTESNKVRWTGA